MSVLSDWVNEIQNIVEGKINKFKTQNHQTPPSILKKPDIKTCLQELHEKYVFAPADKAANNVIIICKKFYLEITMKELGLLGSSTSPTYQKVNESLENLVNQHNTF